MRTSIDLPSYLKNWRDDLVAAAERKRVEAMSTAQEAESIEADIADLDTAIAALEPAPEYDPSSLAHEEELAPALADPPSAELRSVTPATEEESGDQFEDEPSEFISDLTGDPAIEPESGLHGEPEPTELDAPVSIVDDPELQAAVARAEATLQEAEPNYVGLQDPELDADYDAMREREKADKPKLHFSIFGERGNRKLEEV